MELYSGIDLHSNNHYLSIIDENDSRIFQKRLKNDLHNTLEVLEPFKQQFERLFAAVAQPEVPPTRH